MPSRHKKDIGNFLVVVDTSGSVQRDQFEETLSEVMALGSITQKFDLWEFDTEIQYKTSVDKTTKVQDIPIVGRGGTRFQSVVDELKNLREKPQCLIVITDLWLEKTDWTEELKGVETIWLNTCSYTQIALPGKTIQLNDSPD